MQRACVRNARASNAAAVNGWYTTAFYIAFTAMHVHCVASHFHCNAAHSHCNALLISAMHCASTEMHSTSTAMHVHCKRRMRHAPAPEALRNPHWRRNIMPQRFNIRQTQHTQKGHDTNRLCKSGGHARNANSAQGHPIPRTAAVQAWTWPASHAQGPLKEFVCILLFGRDAGKRCI